jgi:hypothetical protein
VFKEDAVTRLTTGAAGVDGVTEEENDGDDGNDGNNEGNEDGKNEGVFGKARDNTVLSPTSHPQVRAATPSTWSSLTDCAHCSLRIHGQR